jgi:16S rRNA (guanine966-N2)-methyltransferase
LFNTLTGLIELTGADVLDLYAGTGAVGLEALSRGAGTATLVESDPAVLSVLRSNVAAIAPDGAHCRRPVRPGLSWPAAGPRPDPVRVPRSALRAA